MLLCYFILNAGWCLHVRFFFFFNVPNECLHFAGWTTVVSYGLQQVSVITFTITFITFVIIIITIIQTGSANAAHSPVMAKSITQHHHIKTRRAMLLQDSSWLHVCGFHDPKRRRFKTHQNKPGVRRLDESSHASWPTLPNLSSDKQQLISQNFSDAFFFFFLISHRSKDMHSPQRVIHCREGGREFGSFRLNLPASRSRSCHLYLKRVSSLCFF